MRWRLRRRHRHPTSVEEARVQARATVPADFSSLPARPGWERLRTAKSDEEAPDPEAGRDTDRDFFLRYAGLG